MKYRILACDDESYITRSISMKLAKAGYEVATAANGEEALESIRESMPALLITDCQMPRMNGVDLCSRLRTDPATENLPVILLTAKGYELNHNEIQSTLGVSYIMAKPFSPRELLRLVNQLVRPSHDTPGTQPAAGDSTGHQTSD